MSTANGHSSAGPQRRVASSDAHPAFVNDEDAARLLREYALTRDTAVRNRLVQRHERLVRSVVNRFQDRANASAEDLLQVGYIGLMAAIERFNPELGPCFSSFAVPTIVGFIKHYLRDQTWGIKVPRHLRELGSSLARRREVLGARLGRPPTIAEMAADAGVSEERLVQAMDLEQAYIPLSLDLLAEDADGDEYSSRTDVIGGPDPALDKVEERETMRLALERLEERQQRILRFRFYQGATQAEVAERLGISQMHVSRLERRALRDLKDLLV